LAKNPRVTLRIIVASKNEIPFVESSIIEATPHVDEIVVVEHNYTHTGLPKPFNFDSLVLERDWQNRFPKVRYLKVDLSETICREATTSAEMHKNEWSMRSSFLDFAEYDKRDIVFAVDADEIIYGSVFSNVIPELSKGKLRLKAFRLAMLQFFYRPNYLWSDLIFKGPVAGHVGLLRRKKIQFRDYGHEWPQVAGCHFSWQLTVDEMVSKLQAYGHNADYAHLANKELLANAVATKTYPFEPERPFTIVELSRAQSRELYPEALWSHVDELAYLLPEKW
jgi:hypothetical protein